MADIDSTDHFFSALEILSSTAVSAADVDRDSLQAPFYADDSILICTLPETPCSPASPSSQTGQTLDPSSCNDSRSFPVLKKRSSVMKRRPKRAKIRSPDSDEAKRDDSLAKERLEDLENETVNPICFPDTPGGHGDRKEGDGSTENMVPSEQLRFVLLDVVKMMCTKPNGRFADTDILDIAAMKGIYFPPPSWWKPGGYRAEVLRFKGNFASCSVGRNSVLGAISDGLLSFVFYVVCRNLNVMEMEEAKERCKQCLQFFGLSFLVIVTGYKSQLISSFMFFKKGIMR